MAEHLPDLWEELNALLATVWPEASYGGRAVQLGRQNWQNLLEIIDVGGDTGDFNVPFFAIQSGKAEPTHEYGLQNHFWVLPINFYYIRSTHLSPAEEAADADVASLIEGRLEALRDAVFSDTTESFRLMELPQIDVSEASSVNEYFLANQSALLSGLLSANLIYGAVAS